MSEAGRAWLSRERHARAARAAPDDPAAVSGYRAQHMSLSRREVRLAGEAAQVAVNDSESPLGWLSRRKGRDGRALIDAAQFLAGERLRAEFTRAQMTPRMTSNWAAPTASGRAGAGRGIDVSEAIVAARQNVRQALTAVGPELSGLLVDVCCFLHGLEDVERARGWPPRSAKVVLQLALDRLARHYGLSEAASGKSRVPVRAWLAADATFTSELG
ncbi:MAG: DNA replication protein [Xanthobacteraceae bacterium]|nr:MAG: DNA replication protein [Xanthobacteraceae bacterium]